MPKLTRRSFIKVTGASALLLAAGNLLAEKTEAQILAPGGKSVSRTTGKPRLSIPSTCLQCPARCGIIGYVEDGQLVKIEGNPRDPNSRGRLCAKGQAGVNHVYNPDRLIYPVKRSGARGQGNWQRISWEEAYGEMASRLRALRSQDRAGEFLFIAGMEGAGGITGRFLKAFGTSSIVEEADMYLANKRVAQELTWGARQEVPDMSASKLVLNFGANPYESHPLFLPLVQRLMEGRLKGARMVTFDPRLSHTAARSDEWFPIKPGTDAAVALAMANVIMQNGLHDSDFISKWSNYSASNLARHLSSYTPEMAQSTSGIKAADITRIALEFAVAKPAVALPGDGVSSHANGVYNERAIALLNAVTGNIDVAGGYCLPRTYDLGDEHLARLPANVLPEVESGGQKVSVLMTHMANPAYNSPNTELSSRVLKSEQLVPFYVACDTYINESAVFADMVLPAATYLESFDIQSMPAFNMVPYVGLTQPVIPPVGEATAFHDVCIQLARRIGGMEQDFNFRSAEHYLRTVVSRIEGLEKAGGVDFLKRNGVWYDPAARPRYQVYQDSGFKTPSGKFEIFSQSLQDKGFSPLPVYEALPAPQKEGVFNLIIFQWNVHTHSRTAECMWLSEIVHDNPVWINSQTAKAMGIAEGDRLKLTTQVGSLSSRAWLTEGLHPSVLAMGACVGHWASGKIARAQSFVSPDPNTHLLWWERHGNGVHPLHIIPVASDPIGGGQAWMDTTVTLSKA